MLKDLLILATALFVASVAYAQMDNPSPSYVLPFKMNYGVITTDGSGNGSLAISCTTTPIISTGVENSGTYPYDVSVTSATNSLISIHVNQGQPLPATLTLLTLLQNYNVFAGSSLSGIRVHVMSVCT